jgi:hypothetical protein
MIAIAHGVGLMAWRRAHLLIMPSVLARSAAQRERGHLQRRKTRAEPQPRCTASQRVSPSFSSPEHTGLPPSMQRESRAAPRHATSVLDCAVRRRRLRKNFR